MNHLKNIYIPLDKGDGKYPDNAVQQGLPPWRPLPGRPRQTRGTRTGTALLTYYWVRW